MLGFGIVMFWVFTALFADMIITHDPLAQVSGMKNKPARLSLGPEGVYYLLGGDNLARDVFSRMVAGHGAVI
jgi:peptide/nickel transport system permease protein